MPIRPRSGRFEISDNSHQPKWLRRDEQLIRTYRLHWTSWIGNVVPVLVSTASIVAIDVLIEHRFAWIGMLACSLGLLAAVVTVLNVRSTKLIVTTERLIFQRGIAGIRRFEVPLDRIFNLDIEQHLVGRMFGFGTLTVQSPSSTMRPIAHLEDPFGAQQTIYDAAEQLQVADSLRHTNLKAPLPHENEVHVGYVDEFDTLAPRSEQHAQQFQQDTELEMATAVRQRTSNDHRYLSPVELDSAIDPPLIR